MRLWGQIFILDFVATERRKDKGKRIKEKGWMLEAND
jgi:hypothetical protein